MTFQLLSADFDDASLGVHSTRTDDGQVLSVLFDHLEVESQAEDDDAAPQVRRAEGTVQCQGAGWVSLEVRGNVTVVGSHGFAHVLGWVNGLRLRSSTLGLDEPFSATVSAPVGANGRLRISLLLLAQRDLTAPATGAQSVVHSIDIRVIASRQRSSGRSARACDSVSRS